MHQIATTETMDNISSQLCGDLYPSHQLTGPINGELHTHGCLKHVTNHGQLAHQSRF